MSANAAPHGITACLAGLKGSVYLKRALENGLPLSRVVSYEQKGDDSQSFTIIQCLARDAGLGFEMNKSPQFAAKELVFVVGWQFLFGHAPPSTIVFHDSLLPRYRGFSPTVAALIRGDRHIGVTALLPTEEVDSGPIVSQASFDIDYPLSIHEALTRQAVLMADMSTEIFAAWSEDRLTATEQDASRATYSIWRDEYDYFIDWSQSADEIARFIDAVGFPYDCAKTFIDNDCLRVVAASVVGDISFEIRQPGKVWRFEDQKPVVVCGRGMIRIDEYAILDGQNNSVKKLRSRFGPKR
jgi:methionyl-tRNA formyltransferase